MKITPEIEAVMRAAYKETDAGRSLFAYEFEELDNTDKDQLKRIAIAVLRALRIPTDYMCESGQL